MVSPWKVGLRWISDSTSRFAIAEPETSGTLIPRTTEYTRLPTTTFLSDGRFVLGEPGVGVQRVMVHRDHAEQVVVGLGDGLAGPVPIDVADLELLEVATEGSLVGPHDIFLHAGTTLTLRRDRSRRSRRERDERRRATSRRR